MPEKTGFAKKNGFSVTYKKLYDLHRLEVSNVIATNLVARNIWKVGGGIVPTSLPEGAKAGGGFYDPDGVALTTTADAAMGLSLYNSRVHTVRIPAAAGTTDIVAQENLTNKSYNLVVTRLDTPRDIQIKVTDTTPSITAGTVTVTGQSFSGAKWLGGDIQVEVDISAGAGTYYTNVPWTTLTSIEVTDAATLGGIGDELFEVGYADRFGMPLWFEAGAINTTSANLLGVKKITGGTKTDDFSGSAVVPEASISDGYLLIAPNTASNGAIDYEIWYSVVTGFPLTHSHTLGTS